MPGREYVVRKENATYYRARIFLDGVRLYQVVVTGVKKDEVLSPAADKFLESFDIAR